MTDICIGLENVAVGLPAGARKPKTVLSNLNLLIECGERIALVGENGSGKTTFLRLLLNAISPSEGVIHSRIDANSDTVAYVPQDYRSALFPWLSLRSNLLIGRGSVHDTERWRLLPSRAAARRAEIRYADFAAAFRLSVNLDAKPGTLSGGQQQLFLLAKALMDTPRLLILDEPLSAVDFGRKRRIAEFLGRRLNDQRTTMVFATHDFDESAFLADRVVILGKRGIQEIVRVTLPWPRTIEMQYRPDFRELVEHIAQEVA